MIVELSIMYSSILIAFAVNSLRAELAVRSPASYGSVDLVEDMKRGPLSSSSDMKFSTQIDIVRRQGRLWRHPHAQRRLPSRRRFLFNRLRWNLASVLTLTIAYVIPGPAQQGPGISQP